MAFLKRERPSQSSVKTASKPKSGSQTPKTSTPGNYKTSSERQREILIAQHRRQEIDKQNESMLRLAQQRQELDLQLLKQEEERLKKEQALILAELQEENRRRLTEATSAELKLTKDVSETSQSLRYVLSEIIPHSQSLKSIRLNNWVTNASTEVKNPTYLGAGLQSRKGNAPRVSNGGSFRRCDRNW